MEKVTRNKLITDAILSGVRITRVAKVFKMSTTNARKIFIRSCVRSNERVFNNGFVGEGWERDGPKLAYLRANRMFFSQKSILS